MMKRRAFITLLGGAAAWPLAARAQEPDRTRRRIGVLANGPEEDLELRSRLAAFRQGLEQLGWSEGRNMQIDYRFSAPDPEQFAQMAKALIASKPDVIFAQTTPAALALQRETRTVPIVFVSVSDPIGSGIVASLARPGGNITGFLLYEDGIIGKWMGMLKEIAPRLERAAIVANPNSTPYDYFLRSAKAVSPSLGIEVVPTPFDNVGEIERVIERFARVPNGGLILPPDTTITNNRDLVVALAARLRLPAVYALRVFVTAGGLMSYSTDIIEQNRQASSYVDRILRGANPADLPVQAPTRYETTLNLKTAKALGLDVPPTLLVRADEVIE
jgi:putative ABC transport system substrate-binding protein